MFNNFENTEDINKVSTVPRAHEHTIHDGNDSETGNSATQTRMKTCCSLYPMH
jgi:hypothetical protein